MPALQIQLFGDFQIVYNSEPLPAFQQSRLQSLLAYLILHRDAPQPRRHVAFLFWPDSAEGQARANLRQTLHLLRQALPDADRFLQIGAQTVQWLPAASFQLDVADFEEQVAQAARAKGRGDEAEAQAALETAVTHYQGDLLPGLYAEWAQTERERLRASFIETLSQLVWLLERQRAYVAAIRHANQLLRHEPLHEETYRRLMRLHALNGDRAAALHLYQTCVALLKRELDVTPNEQTQAAYHSLLAHKTPAVLRPTAETEAALFSPLVGRQTEWRQLLSAWRAAADQAHFVVIAGEAGIGKSRLAEELYHWVSKQGMAVAHSRAYAAEGTLAYAPVTEWLRTEVLRTGWQRLDAVWLSELARLLRELLVEQPNLPQPEPLTESWQRKRLFEALAHAVQSVPTPLLLVLDDLQWCDYETLAWLHYLLRAGISTHLLIVGTVRPEEVEAEHPLTALLLELRSAGQVTEIELGPLDLDETTVLAAQTTGQTLAPAAAQQLFQETEGNPLFVVETVRTELSRGVGEWGSGGTFPSSPLPPDSPTSLPPKVHAVIQRRLAQLSPAAHELAGLAAVVGRSFTVPVLAQASELAEDALLAGLDELWQRRIVREQGLDAYDFSHDRIREVTYAALGPIQRRRWHGRLAVALETQHGSDLDEISGQIAVHCDQAGLPEKAIEYYQRAAEVARGMVAYDETTAHLKRALALLDALPETTERLQQALAMLITLGSVVSATHGHAALEAGQIYARAFELCRRVGDQFQTFVARQELRVFYGYCGAWTEARQLAEENLALAQELENPTLLQYAHLGMGVVLHALAELELAQTHFDRSIHQSIAQERQFDHLFFDDALQAALRHSALGLWLLGYPDRARARMDEALALGQNDGQPIRYAMSVFFITALHHFMRETKLAQTRAEELFALCAKYSFSQYLADSMIYSGWVLAMQGEWAVGIAQMRQTLTVQMETGRRINMSVELALLSEACWMAGQFNEGLAALNEALAVVEQTGELFWYAELLRIKGELQLAQGAPLHEVEACYRQAVKTARQQSAKSLELRATVSLARLLQRQGKGQEAHQRLAEIYDWFTEGFDTPDLQDANALLQELS